MTFTIAEAALFLSGSLTLSILLKATIMLVLGLIAVRLTRQSRAAVRYAILAATFGTLAVLPLIAVSGFGFPVEVQAPSQMESMAAFPAVPPLVSVSPSASSDAGSGKPGTELLFPSWQMVAGLIWIAGAMVFLAPLTINFHWLRRLRRNGLPCPELQERTAALAAAYGVRRPVDVLLHEETPAPLVCGFWRPTIILPCDARDWNDVEFRCAVVHELEHVRRGDWIAQLVARAICACYWFHPLVWVVWRRLCLEAERACDDAVIQNEERTTYAEQLVSLARRMSKAHAQPALGMANRSDLSRRVSALLDNAQRRGRTGFLALASTLFVAGIVVFAIAPLQVVAQSAGKQQTKARRSSPLDRALYEAAESGEISDIEGLLRAGANVNCALTGDGSPLIGAARKGHVAAVRFLLDRGADPNMPVSGDGNPLIMAAGEGHITVVSLLLDRGARIDEIVPGDENALIQASGRGHLAVVKLLVSRGANINARVWVEENAQRDGAGEWRSPLSMARRSGKTEVVAYLLQAGARE